MKKVIYRKIYPKTTKEKTKQKKKHNVEVYTEKNITNT